MRRALAAVSGIHGRAGRALPLIALLPLVAGCYLAHERERSCASSEPTRPCTRWEAAGDPVALSAMPSPYDAQSITSAVPSGCGVVVSWYVLSGHPFADTLAFETREIDWSGAPAADVVPHPALTTATNGSGAMELASRDGAVGAVVSTSPGGCRFVALDGHGADRAAPVPLPGTWCLGLESTAEGFSTLMASETGTTPGTLVRVDPNGAPLGTTALDVPAGRALWSRARMDDGTFVLYTFSEDPITAIYSGWLQHLDARGGALAPEVELGVNGVPVQLAATQDGAVSGWETALPGGLPAQVRAIDTDARPMGDPMDLPASGALYGLVLAPTPDRAVIAMWLEDHFDEMPSWRLRTMVLGPDARPRGEPTLVLTGTNAIGMRLLVDPSGRRALVLFDDEGARALPLACAD